MPDFGLQFSPASSMSRQDNGAGKRDLNVWRSDGLRRGSGRRQCLCRGEGCRDRV